MEEYIMYLRKSQMDRDFEDVSVEETLKRHKTILTDFCNRNRLNVTVVLEEVVSGESLSARPQMQKCLEIINTGDYDGVVCMDIDRLSRGSGFDSGYIMQVLQVNNCKIVTPAKTYDLANEQDEQFTDMKFMFSRYELRTIRKRLQQGIEMSVKEGKYHSGNRPYGYDVVKIKGQKGNTLKIIPEEAEVIRLIYKLCIDGLGTGQISNELNKMGFTTQTGLPYTRTRIHEILTNELYYGKIGWGKRRTQKSIVDGKLEKKQVNQKNWNVYDGLHEGIVSEEVWNAANKALRTRQLPRTKTTVELQNPFAGLLFCEKCGKPLKRNTNKTTANRIKEYFQCKTYNCDCMQVSGSDLEDAVVDKMKKWLSHYRITIETENHDLIDYKSLIDGVEKQLTASLDQQEKICQLLETGVYSVEMFTKRNSVLQADIDRLKKSKQDLMQKMADQESVSNHKLDLIPKVQGLLDAYDIMNAKEKNELWKEVLNKIVYYRDRSNKEVSLKVYPKI